MVVALLLLGAAVPAKAEQAVGSSLSTLTATAAEPLACERELRLTMALMTAGMAYMFAAM